MVIIGVLNGKDGIEIKDLRRFKWLCLTWLLILLVVVAFSASGVRMTKLSRDALQQLGQAFYLGMLSSLGVLIWCSAACVALFCSFHLPARDAPSRGVSFLRWIGTLTLVLMFDDLLMLHEQVFPAYLHLSENFFYVFYLVYTCLFLLKFWRFILTQTSYRVLILAFAFFGISVAMDLNLVPGGIDIEDGFKILGITTYAYYCITSSSDLLSSLV